MPSIKKAFILALVGLLLFALWPTPSSHAARITRLTLLDAEYKQVSYLIAGMKYYVLGESDKASSTSVEGLKLEYSTDNGSTWLILPIAGYDLYRGQYVFLPIDPNLVSAKFRMSAYFDPVIGSKTYSEIAVGPYPILQPGDISDFTATPNPDGSVTLKWNDNSNMESYYEITRSGPDGDKTFYVKDTMEHIGPLSYRDDRTNTLKRTIYVYKVTPVIDRYALPENIWPGDVWSIVKTSRELIVADQTDIRFNPPVAKPDAILDLDTPISQVIKWDILKEIDFTIGDVEKKPVTGVKLDREYLTLKPGGSETLTATVSPSDAANTKVKWESSNGQIAEVDGSGKVTAKSPGAAIVSATTEMGNLKAVCLVYVEPAEAPQPQLPPAAEAPNPDPADPPAADFRDIAGHKLSGEISEAVTMGVVFGYSDGTFRPDASVTRAEFASMIVRALKPESEGDPLAFKDEAQIGRWAEPAVRKAVKLGIIKGGSDGLFRPNAKITRAEMIAMVIRASGIPEEAGKKTGFTDDGAIPNWARFAVSKAEETGIIIVGGLPEGKFAPQAPATRADAASAIVRMLKLGK